MSVQNERTATRHFAVSPKRPAGMGDADQRTLAHGVDGGSGHLPNRLWKIVTVRKKRQKINRAKK